MTQQVNWDNEDWTLAYLKDEFFVHLTRIKDTNNLESVPYNRRIFLDDCKYYAQARKIIYWVPITRPPNLIPPFKIYIEDLKSNPKLYSEFQEFVTISTEKEVALFLKEIAVKFFEAINYGYTHNSVIPHIVVGLE